MKAKKIQLTVIGLLFATQLFSEPSSMSESVSNWAKGPSKTGSGGLIGNESAPDDPIVPAGEGLALLLGMAGVYVFRARRKNKGYMDYYGSQSN